MPSPYPEIPDETEAVDAPATEAEPPTPGEKVMGFLDHLEELRWTLVKCAMVMVGFTIVSAIFLREVQDALEWPWHQALKNFPHATPVLRTDTPMEVYGVMIQVCVPPALAASMPFMLYFLGQFVGPALKENEKKVVRPVLLAALALFLGGAEFSFFLLMPAAVSVAIEANEWMGYTMIWTAGSYYSLLTWMVVGLGLVFEFPLVVLALAYFGLVELSTFRKFRRHIFVLCLIIAAVITPTTDPFTMSFVTAPMYVLFELSLLVAAVMLRRKRRAEAAAEALPAG